MCSHYEAIQDIERIRTSLGVEEIPEGYKTDLWPGGAGLFIRPSKEGGREALTGTFGLIPHWAKDRKIARHTYNARAETVAEKPSFRNAWRKHQRCIIPAEAIYEPDWRSGKAVSARIVRADGDPMAIAGLWSEWQSPEGEIVRSYAMLTVNADTHEFMRQFHKPEDEKRMVVILGTAGKADWLALEPRVMESFASSADFQLQVEQHRPSIAGRNAGVGS